MKHIIIVAIICLTYHFTAQGQNVPQGIAYQAVAVKEGSYSVAGQNPGAIYWANKDIKVRFTIFEKYPNGTTQYSELHETTTDDYGVFNVIIGQGVAISGDFETIPWDLGAAHLQVEIDFENTNTYTLTSLERFWSVPYAFVTNQTEGSNVDSALSDLNNKYDYLRNRDKDTVIGNEGVSYQTLDSINKALQAQITALRSSDKDTVIGNELQMLSLKEDSLLISDGNTVVIKHPENFDNDSTNEFQTISLANDTISLSNGGGKIPLRAINNYVNKNASSSTNTNYSQSRWNANCFEGTLIDLSDWGSNNGFNYCYPGGEIYDSAYVFSATTSGTHNGTFIIDLKRDTIFRISNSWTSNMYVGDSVVYVDSIGEVEVIRINRDLSLTKTTFSGGPATRERDGLSYYGGARNAQVNTSRDLVWAPVPSGGATPVFKKYSFVKEQLTTTTNPTAPANLLSSVLGGDSILFGNCLINSNTMKILTEYSFLEGKPGVYFNENIYYIDDKKLYEYSLKDQSNIALGYGRTGLALGFVTNNQLWISCAGGGRVCNLNVPSDETRFLTVSKKRLAFDRGIVSTTFFNRRGNDGNVGTSIYYDSKNETIEGSGCFNGQYPVFKLGFFLSSK